MPLKKKMQTSIDEELLHLKRVEGDLKVSRFIPSGALKFYFAFGPGIKVDLRK